MAMNFEVMLPKTDSPRVFRLALDDELEIHFIAIYQGPMSSELMRKFRWISPLFLLLIHLFGDWYASQSWHTDYTL